jgi:uncharacterized protein YndB with AHSA1/START domain
MGTSSRARSDQHSGQASAVVATSPDALFRALTDIGGLPSWNDGMTSVVERPATLEVGAEWVVEFHVLGRTWRSRSTLEELNVAGRRFVYRSCTEDGNPSYARWVWEVTEEPAGSRVTVAWDLHPVTFWRRVLLVRIRGGQLARTEVPESLAALAAVAVAATSG